MNILLEIDTKIWSQNNNNGNSSDIHSISSFLVSKNCTLFLKIICPDIHALYDVGQEAKSLLDLYSNV